jgi:hypothetical protein
LTTGAPPLVKAFSGGGTNLSLKSSTDIRVVTSPEMSPDVSPEVSASTATCSAPRRALGSIHPFVEPPMMGTRRGNSPSIGGTSLAFSPEGHHLHLLLVEVEIL